MTPLARMVSTGRFLPDHVVTNEDLESRVDTTDEWIRSRTGIRERRLAPDDMGVAEMGAGAGRAALEEAGLEPSDVDLIIVTTATPDRWLPATSCEIQALLGADNAMAFDLMAACTGFLYALSMAEGFVTAGRGDTVLVVSTEKMSSIVDWTDRSTCVLFGDGAGATVVQRSEEGDERGIRSAFLRADGSLSDLLQRPAGGAARPLTAQRLAAGEHLVHMAGRDVFKNAVRAMAHAANTALDAAGVKANDVDLIVPHQANVRIIEATARYAGISMDRVFINLDRYGNMSSASVPVALDEAREQGLVGKGSLVLSAAFGGGLTWGAMTWQF